MKLFKNFDVDSQRGVGLTHEVCGLYFSSFRITNTLYIPALTVVISFNLHNSHIVDIVSIFILEYFNIVYSILFLCLTYASVLQYLLSYFAVFYLFIVMHQHTK